MITHNTINIAIDIDDEPIVLHEVPYTTVVETDSGYRTCRNGDPGVPPCAEMSISLDLTPIELFSIVTEATEDHFLLLPISPGHLFQKVEDEVHWRAQCGGYR